MKAIVFEASRPLQWDGQTWVPVHPATAQQWLDAGEAYQFLSRQWAVALRFIPAELTPSREQWLNCLHDWARIGKWGHWQRFADGYRYRCRKCGGYHREFPDYRREFESEGPRLARMLLATVCPRVTRASLPKQRCRHTCVPVWCPGYGQIEAGWNNRCPKCGAYLR